MVIRQFDICPNPSARSREAVPYVVCMQSHLLSGLPTMLVAPLVRSELAEPFTNVSVPIVLDGEELVLSLPEMAPIDRRSLRKVVGTLRHLEDDIRRALARLFTGF